MNRLPNITALLGNRPWAIPQATHEHYVELLSAYLQGHRASEDVLRDLRAARDSRSAAMAEQTAQSPGVAILALHGPIYPRGSLMVDLCGASDPHGFAAAVTAAAADPQVAAIVLDIDSPGGAVSGIDVAAEAVRRAAARKPVSAVANTTMCSAAYWIASGATEIVAAPGAEVGSIGVIGTHVDYSAQDESRGVKVTYVRSADRKALGQSNEAMDGVVLEQWQKEIGAIHDMFVATIAEGREVPTTTAAAWATGDVWFGQGAVDAGLADRVATLEDVVQGHLQDAAKSPAAHKPARPAASGQEGHSVKFTLKNHKGAAVELDTDSPEAIEAFVQAERAASVQAGAQQTREAFAAALGIEPKDAEPAALAAIKDRAADGKAYRESLLGSIERLTVALHGNDQRGEAAGGRARRLFAEAPIADLEAEVETLEARRDTLVPAGRQSRDASEGEGEGENPKKPVRKNFGYV